MRLGFKKVLGGMILFIMASLGGAWAQEENTAQTELSLLLGSWWDLQGNKYTFSQPTQDTILSENIETVKKEIENTAHPHFPSPSGIEVTTHEREDGSIEIITHYPGDKHIVQIRPSPASIQKEQTLESQIYTLEKEITALKANKRFVWINRHTQQKLSQIHFETLPAKDYEYKGEIFSPEEGRRLLVEKEKKIQELRKLKRYFLIDTTDPIHYTAISQNKNAIKLKITVETAEHTYQYPEAFYWQGKIVGRRILSDPKDVTEIPVNLIGQLLSEWSPPEWIAIDVRKKQDTIERLIAKIWRLHVTYEKDNAAILGLHSPFAKEIILTKNKPIS